jgi:hypothetical protein
VRLVLIDEEVELAQRIRGRPDGPSKKADQGQPSFCIRHKQYQNQGLTLGDP